MKNSYPLKDAALGAKPKSYFVDHPYIEMLRHSLEPMVVDACNEAMVHQRKIDMQRAMDAGEPFNTVPEPSYAFSVNDYAASQAISMRRVADTLEALAKLLAPRIIDEQRQAHEEGPNYHG